jgi:hypothetical protein
MPLSLADLFAYHADEAIRTVLTLMPKSRGRKPKKKRAPASAPKKRLDNLNAKPQELPLSTQPPQEPPPLATAPARGLSTRDIEALFADEHGESRRRLPFGG